MSRNQHLDLRSGIESAPRVLHCIADGAALPEGMLCLVEDLVARDMHDRAAALRAEADAVERAAHDFEGQSSMRRFDVKTARIKDYNEFVNAFAREMLADMQKEAA
jgi:hypothetical protein